MIIIVFCWFESVEVLEKLNLEKLRYSLTCTIPSITNWFWDETYRMKYVFEASEPSVMLNPKQNQESSSCNCQAFEPY